MTWSDEAECLADVRRYWLAGLCLCDGAELDWYGPPTAVAEGVLMCGRCIENHHDADDVLPKLLRALIP